LLDLRALADAERLLSPVSIVTTTPELSCVHPKIEHNLIGSFALFAQAYRLLAQVVLSAEAELIEYPAYPYSDSIDFACHLFDSSIAGLIR
jgi:hypothetical protein